MLIITVADPERFTPKGKPVKYTGALVEFYNWRNRRQVYEIHGIIELEKMRILFAENLCNLGIYWIIKISLVLRSTHVVPKNQDKVIFYVNNYINLDQFNQLYNLDRIEKNIRNVDAVACKLGLASTKATNQRLEVAREERQTKEEIVERQKTKTMAIKCRRARGGISLSSEEEENDETETGDEIDPDQADNDENPLQL